MPALARATSTGRAVARHRGQEVLERRAALAKRHFPAPVDLRGAIHLREQVAELPDGLRGTEEQDAARVERVMEQRDELARAARPPCR